MHHLAASQYGTDQCPKRSDPPCLTDLTYILCPHPNTDDKYDKAASTAVKQRTIIFTLKIKYQFWSQPLAHSTAHGRIVVLPQIHLQKP